MIGFTCSAVATQMLVELGVKNPLGERLLQFVNQTIFIEHVFRVASGQKLVKQVFLDCHMMLHPFSSSWPHTQDSGQSPRSIRICCGTWRSSGRTKSGAPTSPTSRCGGGS